MTRAGRDTGREGSPPPALGSQPGCRRNARMRTAFLLSLVIAALVLVAAPARADDGDADPRRRTARRRHPDRAAVRHEGRGRLVARRSPSSSGAASHEELGLRDRRSRSVARRSAGPASGTASSTRARRLTVTAEREEKLDFTHAFYTSGLGIAASRAGGGGLGTILARVVLHRLPEDGPRARRGPRGAGVPALALRAQAKRRAVRRTAPRRGSATPSGGRPSP